MGWVDGNAGQMLNQAMGCLIAIVLGMVGTYVILKACDAGVDAGGADERAGGVEGRVGGIAEHAAGGEAAAGVRAGRGVGFQQVVGVVDVVDVLAGDGAAHAGFDNLLAVVEI